MAEGSSAFNIPVFDRKEIVKHLQESGGPALTEDSLLRPSSDLICSAFEFLLLGVKNISSREELEQPVFAAIDLLEYPELYYDSVGISHIVRSLRIFMHAAGVDEFSIWDIIRPQPQKVVRLFSASINLYIYSNQKHKLLAEFQESHNALQLALQQQLEDLQAIESQIESIEADRDEHQPQVQALDEEIKELEQCISVVNKEHTKLQQDVRNKKQENQDLADKITNVNFSLMEKQQERAQLQSQIVENPEKIKLTLEEKKKSLQEEGAVEENLSKGRRNLKANYEFMLKVGRSYAKWSKMIQSMEEQVESVKSLEKEMRIDIENTKNTERGTWDADSEIRDLARKEMMQEEMIKELERHGDLKHEEISSDKGALQLLMMGLQAQWAAANAYYNQADVHAKNSTNLKAEKEPRLAKIDAIERLIAEKVNEYNLSILGALPKEVVQMVL